MMRHLRGLSLWASLAALTLPVAALAECAEDRLDIRGDWGQASFTIEIADTPDERSQGLMHRESLPFSSGMLFIYEYPQAPVFWMRNTLIPLDMIFIRPDGVVQHIHANAIPLDEETRPTGGDGVLAVLEINGGLSERMGIEPGSEIRHPAFAEDAAWPCAPDAPDAPEAPDASDTQ